MRLPFLFLVLCLGWASSALGQPELYFVATQDNRVYLQNKQIAGDAPIRVIVTPTGVFVLAENSKTPQSLLEFDIKTLKSEQVELSAFFQYSGGRYTKFITPSEERSIRGSFRINTNDNVGLSIVYDKAVDYLAITKRIGAQQAMLAIKSNRVVANLTQEPVFLLAPNIPKVIEAVELSASGLQINGKPFAAGAGLGLDVETPVSPCLKDGPDIKFLDSKTFTRIRSEKDPARQAALLKQALSRQANPLTNLIVLQAKTTRIAAYDPQRERLVIIEPRSGENTTICVVSDLDLKNSLAE